MSNSRQPHHGPKGQSNDNLSARAQGTWPQQRSSKAQRAAKAARVHTLTDPLGAKGFRATAARVRNETSARRKVLLASVATFAASFGVMVATNHTPANADPVATMNLPATTTNQPAATTSNSQAASSNGSTVGSALDLFSGQTANGLTNSTNSSSSTTTRHHDDGEGDDNENGSSLQTTQSNANSSSQAVTSTTSQAASNQTNQSSFFVQQPVVQQPSHTQSGGS